MKNFVWLFTILMLSFSLVHSQSGEFNFEKPGSDKLRQVENDAFKVGEHLKYRVHYGLINAGVAELEVKRKTVKSKRPVYHMVGTGRSVGMVEWFFRTRDRYETYMDTEAMIPWEFIRDVDEGGYIIKRHVIFDHHENQAVDLEKSSTESYNIMDNAQDLFSMFYYARCLNTKNLKVGEMIPIDLFLDHEDWSFRLKYLGTEYVSTKWGKVRCKKFIPVVQDGRVFSDEEGMTLWVTDDESKIPVRLQAELAVGSIKMDLMDYKNLVRPISFQ